jgi:hypothetical protein
MLRGSIPLHALKGIPPVRLPRKIAGLLLAVATAAGLAAVATPAHAAQLDVMFGTNDSPTGHSSGLLCLEADPGPNFQWQVDPQPCGIGNMAQRWEELPQGGGVSKWMNRAVGWCLDADQITDGGIIALWDCNANITNTRWVGGTSNGRLESRISGSTGHCLTVPGDENTAGVWTVVEACNGGPAQGIRFTMVGTL